jgi:hypothetical protein
VAALVFAGTAAVLLSGCSTAGYSGSRIEMPAADGKARGGTTLSFQIDALKVSIHGGDVTREGGTVPRLRLLLVFEPPEIGYSFDPSQVVLRSAEGQEWRPRAWGPGLLDGKTPTCSAPQLGEADSSYHFLSPKTCFGLAFDLTIEADTRVDLVLGGLARGRRALDPVTLRISRKSWRSIEHIWPLEILLLPVSGGG